MTVRAPDSAFRINQTAQLECRYIGREKTPILVWDEFLESTDTLTQDACNSQSFGRHGRGLYPGVRADLPDEYLQAVQAYVTPFVRDYYNVDGTPASTQSVGFYSLTSTPASQLSQLQSIPHFDSPRAVQFALLHYLQVGGFGGTGFFRHRTTGYECLSEQRVPRLIEACESYWQHNGLPVPGYCNGSDGQFELIDSVAYRPNRLLLYPACILHSALVSPERDLSDDPSSGRLTANLFIDFGMGADD